ncbi:MAG: cytochrome c-type biogenesis CcmF C-terminal domain-containing protein [Ilumatobacteraceae bacterium]
MIVLVGRLCLVAALAGAVTTAFAGWSTARRGERHPWLRRGVLLTGVGMVAALVTLEVALIADRFEVQYVAEHHRRATSTFFTITSAWAGLEGSLLLWATVIALYLVAVGWRVTGGRSHDAKPDRLGAGALVVMGIVAAFFTGLVLFVTPTFAATPRAVADGSGANPLLQDHVLMAIHPPLLYLGYVGFLVPFAFALSALALRERGPRWVLRTQAWALVAWTFLTAGIVIGGWWSYDVLGWGGYWAWDPVENASFLPWLVGTAYLHSAVMQARRGMLPAWSVGLVISTFVFTLLGTFLARSGVIASVHAFSESSLGPVLLVFLLVTVAIAVYLFVTRLRDVVTGPPLQSLAGREGVFLLNNLLLATFAVVVLVGTAYPIVVEAIDGDRISVGRPFFDVFAVWISLALLAAMCIGAVIPYRRCDPRALWGHVRLPLQVGLAMAAVLVVAAGLRAPYVIVVVVLATTIVATAARELVVAVRQRTDHRGRWVALGGALRARPGFWGGQLAHVGLALVAVGIAASANLAQRSTVTLTPGDTVAASGYSITYVHPSARTTPMYEARGAVFRVARGGESRTMSPEFHQFPNQVQPVGEPAVWTSWRGDDAYLSLLSLDENGAVLHVYRYPWLSLIWVGGLTCAAGGALSIGLRLARRRAERSSIARALVEEPAEAAP